MFNFISPPLYFRYFDELSSTNKNVQDEQQLLDARQHIQGFAPTKERE